MSIPLYRVSNVAAYARWKEQEEQEDIGWLYNSIFAGRELETESMRRGTAFHKALEELTPDLYEQVSANGYTFQFECDCALRLPFRHNREVRAIKDYGGIVLTGKCDGILGRVIDDHKTTSIQFDAEYHLTGWQHKFYLDMFNADRFRWHGWVLRETEDVHRLKVVEYHLLEQFRYPELEQDCTEMAHEFRDFAERLGWKGLEEGSFI